MKLLVQPGDGITSLLRAIDGAKRSVDIMIFRFNRKEIQTALMKAAARGVTVRALIASTNRGGEAVLRELETNLLGAGVTVARTADDLVRYHGKYMIVDRRELFLMAFNLTFQDIERSRSFAVVTTNAKLVGEAIRLFEADTKRQPYHPANPAFLVSPHNARPQLAEFLAGAKKELVIWDPKISDRAMIRVLAQRAKAGVAIRIMGRLTREIQGAEARRLAEPRLHTRTIVRDGKHAFIGSQSLRSLELDSRREVGTIFRNTAICKTLCEVFERDWNTVEAAASAEARPPAARSRRRSQRRWR